MDWSKVNIPEKKQYQIDWTENFSSEELQEGRKIVPDYDITGGWRGYSAVFQDRRNQILTSVYHLPTKPGQSFTTENARCTCTVFRHGRLCRHIAAMMYNISHGHKILLIEESDRDYDARIAGIKQDYLVNDRKKQIANAEEIPLTEYFHDQLEQLEQSGIVLFDLAKALKGMRTNKYFIRLSKYLEPETVRDFTFAEEQQKDQPLTVTAAFRPYVYDPKYIDFRGYAVCSLTGDHFNVLNSSVWPFVPENRYFDRQDKPVDILKTGLVNEYVLAMLKNMFPLILEMSNQDLTDDSAIKFFESIDREDLPASDTPEETRVKKIEISPRITIEDGNAQLTFKAGIQGRKMIVIRNLYDFCIAYRNRHAAQLSKKESVDFSICDVTEQSSKWMDFILRRIGETEAINDRLWSSRYNYTSISTTYSQDLKGSLLDSFYDTAEGSECEYQDKTNDIKGAVISVGHHPVQFQLKAERLADARGNYAGLTVSGNIPVMISGAVYQYILNGEYLSRITREEEQTFRPFDAVSDASGYFRFQVGLEKLNQFYYRVLPKLMENPCVELINNCAEETQQYLPPEALFTFYFDYVRPAVFCRADVSYGEQTSVLKLDPVRGERTYFDEYSESRTAEALHHFLNEYDPGTGIFSSMMDDDELYVFLQTGLPWLERFGTIRGTDAFRRLRVRPVPSVKVGVSVDSGIMDIDVTSSELSEDELLELLDSYTKKKKYYQLSSGDFIDLTSGTDLAEVSDFMNSLDLVPTEVIRQKAHIPVYRALYLDRMLEEHAGLAASGDRTYRNLIRSFKTVTESDYEVPAVLEPVLRPYQAFGYKWLKTLEEYGFGGILADEMGLGKTVQMIAVFQSAKESGETLPSLVVCPASLVYNWQEEISRFAPDLSVTVLAGSGTERKHAYAAIREMNNHSDVYVISYDLLKRDAVQYEDLRFHTCVLDEAQYIKNQKSAAAKSVKVIHSIHRYALTGTPIENRLSELWSIFDFIMPGFLYSSQEFIRRFETPITKQKDEAVTAKLKKMVGPFILRRKKEEVLKDLPAKLEEVRYARFSGEQQKLYDAQVVHMKSMIGSSSFNSDKIRIFAELTRIRQICCDPSLIFENYQGESTKRQACMELIESAIDGGHRILVFSQFVSMLELLEEDLKNAGITYFKITGETPKETRISLVHQFNDGDTPVFLISLKAGGTGLNLTGADVVIHYDPWWNLAAQNQATDRAHRIGQTRQVTVYKMIVKDSIEEKIMELQDAKKDLADAILEGKSESLMSLSQEELLELLS